MTSIEIDQSECRLVKVCGVDDIPSGEMKCFRPTDDRHIAVYNVDGQFYATDDRCTHGQASLSNEGFLDGCVVECSWHLGAFDVRTGEPVASPCEVALRTYSVVVRDDGIFIKTADRTSHASSVSTSGVRSKDLRSV